MTYMIFTAIGSKGLCLTVKHLSGQIFWTSPRIYPCSALFKIYINYLSNALVLNGKLFADDLSLFPVNPFALIAPFLYPLKIPKIFAVF